jgi:MerR family transcriptional regulator, light-induced transcriptional regulator
VDHTRQGRREPLKPAKTASGPRTDGTEWVLPRYTVRAVAQRLGVPTATLRSWTQRYGVGPSNHRPGRHRLYSENDVAVVQLMHSLVRQGTNPGAAAQSAMAMVAQPRADPASLLSAAFDLDAGSAGRILDGQLRRYGVLDTWNSLVRPAFREIDARQAASERCIDVEHALSWTVARSLQRIGVTGGQSMAPSIILACTESETHTLSLEALRAALAESGHTALMLGADVPVAALLDAVERRRSPSTVMLWAQTARTADHAVVKAAAPHAKVVLGGPGWNSSDIPKEASTVSSLRAAVQRLRPRPRRRPT